MAISSITQSSNAIGAYTSQAQADGAQRNPLSALLRKEESAPTRLSAFGQVKLSLDDLKARAQALKNLNNPPTLSDFKVAVQGFVQSFNALNKTVRDVTAQAPANLSLAEDSRPSRALNEVRKAAASPNEGALASLRNIGVSARNDGTFAVNQARLEQAFQEDRQGTLSLLSDVASRVEKVIDEQNSPNDFIGSKVNDLSERGEDPENVRNDVRERLDSQKSYQQRLAAQLATAGGYVARNAVATYFSVASL